MILGDPANKAPGGGGRTAIDDIFRRAVVRRPDAIALIDPPDRMETEGMTPRRLTYAQADHMVSAIAGRLRRIGLSTDAVVGTQLPNNVDGILTFLGILRAGMIAAPLPLLWRRGDCITALSRIGAKAFVTCGEYRGVDHCQIAMEAAAEIFPIRYVCGFGANLPDGVIPLHDLHDTEHVDPVPAPTRERQSNLAAHVAAITFDVTTDGLIAVARSHLEFLSAAVAVVIESKVPQDAVILSTVAPTSLAGISAGIMPWLFCGGTLALHEPFTPELFGKQISEHRCDTLVLPGIVMPRLAEAGMLPAEDGVKTILALWRTPERLAGSAPWRDPRIAINDIMVFGETALVAGRRGEDGKALPLPLGSVTAPRGGANTVPVAEVARTDAGTVAIRGPMVPRHPFPPDAERAGLPSMRIAPDGMVNTGYTCRVEYADTLVVTGPPPGLVSVGGYRFGLRDLQELAANADPGSTLAALPDALTGHRLAGSAPDRTAIRHALAATGANPLVVRAFRDRAQPDAA